MNDLLTILTVRTASERFPNKVVAKIEGEPLMGHIIKRFQMLGGNFCVATTAQKEDDIIENIARDYNTACYRYEGNENDVVKRMEAARQTWFPGSRYILRALGDCPFYSWELGQKAIHVLNKQRAEVFLWYLLPEVNVVYGSREFPYRLSAWQRIVSNARGDEREHIDLYFDRHRDEFNIIYHEPPDHKYFRPLYRLEVDWPEDLQMVRIIAKNVGMQASVKDIIRFLDDNPKVAKLNENHKEKTGPTVSFTYRQHRQWFKLMRGAPVLTWDNIIWMPPDKRATQIFCNSGRCMVGWGWQGKLYTKEGHILNGPGLIDCECGSKVAWKKAF